MTNDLAAPPAPNFSTTPAIGVLVGSAARTGLTALGGWLISRGFLDSSAGDALVTVGSGLVLALVAQGWSWWQKWRSQKQTIALVSTALAMPKNSTVAELIKAAPAAQSIVITTTPTP